MLCGCIECHRIWCGIEEFNSLDLSELNLDSSTDISHGICPECFQRHKDRVHQHQKNNGYSECYDRNDNCNNNKCLFKPACGNSAINSWRSSIVLLNASNLASD